MSTKETANLTHSAGQPKEGQGATRHHRVVIVGGGTGGTTVARQLEETLEAPDIALIEPSDHHYDQPEWLRVGTGTVEKEQTQQAEASVIPEGVHWIHDQATAIDPDAQVVTVGSGERIGYDYLVIAVGVEVRWDRIRGLEDGLSTNGICSIYGYEPAEKTWQMIKGFQEGRAVFTAPSSPFKGGGAPLKILHRADDFWREAGVRKQIELLFATAGSADFGGEEYVELVERDAREKDASVYFGYDLVEVRPESREAVFQVSKREIVSRDLLRFDLLHVVPPMRPPEVVAKSPLAYQVGPMKGYLEVNPETLRHRHYKNVFGLGDVAGLFTEKTGEKARKQATTLARNLQRRITEEQ